MTAGAPMQETVFTIGHSTHPEERFIALLRQHEITAVCDVRSKPYSRLNPQFNRQAMENTLREAGINYVFLGKELGARSDDPACYQNGRVQYERLAQTGLFQQGIERVRFGMAKGFRIALMCAEKEPLECHRTILVARHLTFLGIHVQHILPDGSLEKHDEAIQRLARQLRVPEAHMFRSEEDVIMDAYRLQEDRSTRQQEELYPQTSRSGILRGFRNIEFAVDADWGLNPVPTSAPASSARPPQPPLPLPPARPRLSPPSAASSSPPGSSSALP
jgi:uncharacterized protein DUF488